MNKLNILKTLFPQPQATFTGRGGEEVNGLPAGTVPQNCEILLRALEKSDPMQRREHYLVQLQDVLVYARVCTAMEGCGYDEFAVIHGIAVFDEDKQKLREWAHSFITSGNCH